MSMVTNFIAGTSIVANVFLASAYQNVSKKLKNVSEKLKKAEEDFNRKPDFTVPIDVANLSDEDSLSSTVNQIVQNASEDFDTFEIKFLCEGKYVASLTVQFDMTQDPEVMENTLEHIKKFKETFLNETFSVD